MQSFSRTWIKNASKRLPMFLNKVILLLIQLLILGCSSFESLVYDHLDLYSDLSVTFNYLCRTSNTMTIRVKVMAWNDNQRFYFISFQNSFVNLLYLSSTYLGSGSQGHGFKSQCQWAGYGWVLGTTTGIAQTWIKSFLKQIIKATVLTWQLKMNFQLCSFSQALW